LIFKFNLFKFVLLNGCRMTNHKLDIAYLICKYMLIIAVSSYITIKALQYFASPTAWHP
jgi:hypothetical protein